MNFSSSGKLIKNTKHFIDIRHYSVIDRLLNRYGIFYGWGRKKSGKRAVELAEKCGTGFTLLEDGFIRSFGLGVDGFPAFSIVEDDTGIYYDATTASKLENLLNDYDFASDHKLMETTRKAMQLIREHRISKYNHAPDVPEDFFSEHEPRVLIVAQTAGDASLRYGLGEQFTTDQMIDAAVNENPDAVIYLKIHPDVLSGKKDSDIDINAARKRCVIIDIDLNPISLIEHFETIYTKTSQMGFEALLLGKRCVCFGMPFYAGWGITDDRVTCDRRKRKLSVEEVFAAAYILYARYYNPYRRRPGDILDTIREIVRQRRMRQNRPLNDRIKRVLAIGDSHIRVFEHRYFRRFFPDTEYKIVYVPGATASGIQNVDSLTRAYTIFKAALEEGGYDEIIVTLGEVDAAYAVWKRAEAHNVPVETILGDIATKYSEFILSLEEYAPTTVLSTPLQTIDDCKRCGDETSLIRASIDVPIRERTALTLELNRRIKSFCTERGIGYLDLDPWSLGKNGLVRSWLLHPNNPCDHHYYRWRYALMIIAKMKMRQWLQ